VTDDAPTTLAGKLTVAGARELEPTYSFEFDVTDDMKSYAFIPVIIKANNLNPSPRAGASIVIPLSSLGDDSSIVEAFTEGMKTLAAKAEDQFVDYLQDTL
jgi:hypothetical protein